MKAKDLKRLTIIGGILVEEGFGFVVNKLKFIKVKKKGKEDKRKPEVRLRKTLERLGPTFVKFGQLLSVRPDLVPIRYAKELSKLQDSVPSFSTDDVKKIIHHELGRPVTKVFKQFEETPLASASISQVHRATMHDGSQVVVKVQRPGIENIMKEDIDLLLLLAHHLEKHVPKAKRYEPVALVREFADWTKKELDFTIEAKNAQRFKKNFADDPKVRIPHVYPSCTSKKVLTLSFMDGIDLRHRNLLKKKHINVKQALELGFDAILTQIFEHGFFHGDPHPGNILLFEDGSIGFIDFGIVGKFTPQLREEAIEMLLGVLEDDIDKLVDFLIRINKGKKPVDEVSLRGELADIVEPIANAKIEDIEVSKILEQVIDTAFEHHIRMPTDFALFGKSILTMEGVALEYDPSFTLTRRAQPFIERLIKKKYQSKGMAKSILRELNQVKRQIFKIPKQVNMALRKVQEGRVKVDIDNRDIRELSKELDRSSNRLSYGLIIAALIIGGAWVMDKGDPVFLGAPAMTVALFFLAILMGVTLSISIMREVK